MLFHTEQSGDIWQRPKVSEYEKKTVPRKGNNGAKGSGAGACLLNFNWQGGWYDWVVSYEWYGDHRGNYRPWLSLHVIKWEANGGFDQSSSMIRHKVFLTRVG